MRKYDPTYYFSHSDKGVVTEESLLREPKLWMPGQKPTGPVKIDWMHPLSKGLVSCRILNTFHRGEDLAFSDNYTIAGAPFRYPNEFYIDYGVDRLIYGKNPADLIDSEYTIITSMSKVINGSNSRLIVGSTHTDYSYEYGFYFTGNSIVFYYESGSFIYLKESLPSTYDYVNLAVRYDGSQVWAYPLTNNHATATTLTSAYTFSIGTNWYPDTAEYKAKYFYIYNRFMPINEIDNIVNDPYQFLVPA